MLGELPYWRIKWKIESKLLSIGLSNGGLGDLRFPVQGLD